MAQGATIQAAIVNEAVEKNQDLLLHDITPFSLGIEARMKRHRWTKMDILIKKDDAIPATKENIFTSEMASPTS